MKTTKASEYFVQYALIVLGSALFAAGFQFFLYPNSIIVGCCHPCLLTFWRW